ncbi:MAG TPA: DUF4331 domain-containing protein [Actinomycetota bacterium]|nr:DUF4331 domain-containing protein [Actinomycetota bacterium]
MSSFSKRLRLTAVGGLAAASMVAGVLSGLGPVPGGASSHREAPLVAADPQVDNTDLYVFNSPDSPGTVTFISNWIPFEEPAGGPNFYAFAPRVKYHINIDNSGDARADIVYWLQFSNHYRNPNTFLYNTGQVTSLADADLNFYQTYDLRRTDVKRNKGKHGKVTVTEKTTLLVNDAIVVPSHVGAASMPDYAALRTAGINTFNSGASKVLAGQADDPFFLDLRVFDLLYGAPDDPPAGFDEAGDDTLKGFNVNTIALQIPESLLAMGGDATANPIIGVWSTASRRSTRVIRKTGVQKEVGTFRQVSRLGMPLVNEVVVPVGTKNYWNASDPRDDAQFLGAVTSPELPTLVALLYGIPAPATPRNDLVQVFLTGLPGLNQPAGVRPSEMLRLNMSTAPAATPNRLGAVGGDNAGFPNGRRLADDTIDIALQVVEGVLLPGHPAAVNTLGDGVDTNDAAFGTTFPYVALPHAGSLAAPH